MADEASVAGGPQENPGAAAVLGMAEGSRTLGGKVEDKDWIPICHQVGPPR